MHKPRTHDRRQRHSHDPRQDHRHGKCHRKLQEQRAGQAALETDRRVDRGQRDRHGDDRTDQFARTGQRRLDPGLTQAHMPLDILDDDDRVVHHQPDRQHNREQRQQIEAEAEREHERRRTNQRHRHRDERYQRGAHRAHEEKHDQRHDQDRLR